MWYFRNQEGANPFPEKSWRVAQIEKINAPHHA
jgi:hypothetical protein